MGIAIERPCTPVGSEQRAMPATTRGTAGPPPRRPAEPRAAWATWSGGAGVGAVMGHPDTRYDSAREQLFHQLDLGCLRLLDLLSHRQSVGELAFFLLDLSHFDSALVVLDHHGQEHAVELSARG